MPRRSSAFPSMLDRSPTSRSTPAARSKSPYERWRTAIPRPSNESSLPPSSNAYPSSRLSSAPVKLGPSATITSGWTAGGAPGASSSTASSLAPRRRWSPSVATPRAPTATSEVPTRTRVASGARIATLAGPSRESPGAGRLRVATSSSGLGMNSAPPRPRSTTAMRCARKTSNPAGDRSETKTVFSPAARRTTAENAPPASTTTRSPATTIWWPGRVRPLTR